LHLQSVLKIEFEVPQPNFKDCLATTIANNLCFSNDQIKNCYVMAEIAVGNFMEFIKQNIRQEIEADGDMKDVVRRIFFGFLGGDVHKHLAFILDFDFDFVFYITMEGSAEYCKRFRGDRKKFLQWCKRQISDYAQECRPDFHAKFAEYCRIISAKVCNSSAIDQLFQARFRLRGALRASRRFAPSPCWGQALEKLAS